MLQVPAHQTFLAASAACSCALQRIGSGGTAHLAHSESPGSAAQPSGELREIVSSRPSGTDRMLGYLHQPAFARACLRAGEILYDGAHLQVQGSSVDPSGAGQAGAVGSTQCRF